MRLSGLLLAITDVYGWMILIRVILSWIPYLPSALNFLEPAINFIIKATDWVLVPVRRFVPPLGAFDFSPFVAYLLVMAIGRWAFALLLSIGL